MAAYVSFAPLIIFFIWHLTRELFRYTHYPMRFNRKTRKMYGLRFDGTVMTADWDSLVVTLGKGTDGDTYVCLHRMDAAGKLVLDTFSLPVGQARNSPHLLRFWEFVRRYMEDGPEKLADQVITVRDISTRREGYWRGFWTMTSDDLSQAPWIIVLPLSIFTFLYAAGRWLAIHTSKIPQWPEDIERECAIDPNDPYLRDAQHLAPLPNASPKAVRLFKRLHGMD